MLVVRNIRECDIESLFQLVGQAEKGLTSLKVSRDSLVTRVSESLRAFANPTAKPAGQPYVFVMEDTVTQKIVGTSAIYSKVGGFQPNYTYQIETKVKQSEELGVKRGFSVLHLKREHDGPTEIGSLFLDPGYWGKGLGRLLSLARFIFMADFPSRFEKEVIAEMRGIVDENGRSPLWSALGAHFFQIEYPKADTLTSESKKFIADLMPEYPIYVTLLPEEAQKVIGKVHDNTRPALELLKQEGFEYRGVVDIFDGGPAVHCEITNIRTVRQSISGSVGNVVESVTGDNQLLISNSKIEFCCCLGHVNWHEQNDNQKDDQKATIDTATAKALNLKVGDPLRTVTIKPLKK